MTKRKRYKAEEIIEKLREAEVLVSQGKTVQEAARALAISEQTLLSLAQRIRWDG
jgi:putative transposase